MEHDVRNPIKRWISIPGKEEGKPRRFDVKYEGAPHFCFFCGIFGHNERSCLLPEEEKYVRYCEEQLASPFRWFEHRSYYVPAEDKKTKRSLHYSPASSGWKLAPESGIGGAMPLADHSDREEEKEAEMEEEVEAIPALIQDVLAAAVTNLSVADGPTKVTDVQVTDASEAVKKKLLGTKRYKLDKAKKLAAMCRAGGSLAQEALGTTSKLRVFNVPPILECLREDGSLYAELRGDADQTASAFMKKKKQVLGKRQASEDTSMDDGSQSFIIRFGGGSDKRTKGPGATSQEVNQEEEDIVVDEEATSPGAAGQLTGTDDRACQEQ